MKESRHVLLESLKTDEKYIMLLNSGGFDSVILGHLLREANPGIRVLSLTFDYNQPSGEISCALNLAKKLDMMQETLKIPIFEKENLQKDNQEIPFRNLIFFSYAAVFAKKYGINYIYSALLGNSTFSDSSEAFVSHLNAVLLLDGSVQIKVPLLDYDKTDIFMFSKYFNISKDDYCSCNKIDPCAADSLVKCPDCTILDELQLEYERYIAEDIGVNFFDETKPSLISPAKMLKIAINDKCQLRCSHCVFSEQFNLPKRVLTLREWQAVFQRAKVAGITEIEISGLEPFYDDFIFELLPYMKDFKVLIITNGVNFDLGTMSKLNSFPQVKEIVFSIGQERGRETPGRIKNLFLYDSLQYASISYSLDYTPDLQFFRLEGNLLPGVPIYIKSMYPSTDDGENYLRFLRDMEELSKHSFRRNFVFCLRYSEWINNDYLSMLVRRSVKLADYEICRGINIYPEFGCSISMGSYDSVYLKHTGEVLSCAYTQFHLDGLPNVRDFNYDVVKAAEKLKEIESDCCLSLAKNKK